MCDCCDDCYFDDDDLDFGCVYLIFFLCMVLVWMCC